MSAVSVFPRAGARAQCLPLAALAALCLMVAALVAAEPALAQERYGDARVEQGKLTVVREGKKFPFEAGGPAAVVIYGDLLVVHSDSRVVVDTVEGVRMTVGANAAFQVKPFKERESLGVLRILFGRMRASLEKLTAGQQFNIKTSQAVIGVKGTEFTTSVTAQGDTLVVVEQTDNEVSLAGLEGPERALTPDVMAVVVNSKPVSDAALVTPEVRQALVIEDLASPAAYQPEAKALRGEEVLVRSGIVSEKDLIEAKRERATLQDAIRFDEQAQPLSERYQLRPESVQPFLEWNVFLRPTP